MIPHSTIQTGNIHKLRYAPTCAKVPLQVNSLWIPYIIFRNTDTDEAVTVAEDTRQTCH